MKQYIIYHDGSGCIDGLTSAWIAWKKFGSAATLIPMNYGDKIPDFEPGSEVYILDFSLPPAELMKLFLDGRRDSKNKGGGLAKIVQLDHHASAMRDFLTYNMFCDEMSHSERRIETHTVLGNANYKVIFDMDKSGAGLAWEYFNPDTDMPDFVKYVQDRDLWKFEYQGTQAFHAHLLSLDLTVNNIDRISLLNKSNIDNCIEVGAYILYYQKQVIKRALQNINLVTLRTRNNEFIYDKVPTLNINKEFASDAAHEMLNLYPDAKFVAVYYDRQDKKREFSLRSKDIKLPNGNVETYDVGFVAKQFGGGGHHRAAGFTVTIGSIDDPLNSP